MENLLPHNTRHQNYFQSNASVYHDQNLHEQIKTKDR